MQNIDHLSLHGRPHPKAKLACFVLLVLAFLVFPARAETIRLEQSHGIFVLSVQVNGTVNLPFILDSGATDVVIPADAFLLLSQNNGVKDSDYLGVGTSILADGTKITTKRFNLHELRVGNHVIRDVVASVTTGKGISLLGQSFLSRLPSWTIDNKNHALVLVDLPASTIVQPASTPAAPEPTAAVLPFGSVTAQYNYAFDLFRDGNYSGAEVALKAFVQQHPDDLLAANAQYWIAETYFARRQFKEAALAYAEGYKQYPRGPKAPEGLLRLGMSLARAGEAQEACVAFVQLEHEFPNPQNVIRERTAAEKSRIGC
jgi:tol-pal system protein YbgF